MKNKLKKENNILIKADKEYSKKFPKDRLQVDLNYARILIKQAKLSQKQEDDERFEEFIRLLKDCLREGNNPISSDYLREKIDKLAEELNGEQKQ